MKKVLSLVLALVMVLGSFSFVSAAPYSDVAGTVYESAVDRLALLEVLKGYPDGSFKPEATITRAEFAAVAVRIRGLENAANAVKGLATGFTDVNAVHWASGYVGTAGKLGIVNGVGNGLFAPEAPVKYEEAVTMIVRSLGYEAAAQAKGGYPYGYLIVANEIGLLDEVKGTQGAPAPRGIVAQIADNALEIPMMIQVGFGTDTKWVVSGSKEHGTDAVERYLLDEMGFDSVEGTVITVNTKTDKITVDPTDEDLKKNVILEVAEGFDFYEVEGLETKFWSKDDLVIVYVVKEDAKFDAVEVDKDELTLVVEDENYEVVTPARDAKLVLDGKAVDQDKFNADFAKIVLNDDDEIEWAQGYTFDGFILVEEVKNETAYSFDDYDEVDLEDFTVVKAEVVDGAIASVKTIGIAGIEENDILFYNNDQEFAIVYNNGTEGELDRVYTDLSFRFEGKAYGTTDLVPVYFDDNKVGELEEGVLKDFLDDEVKITVYVDFAGNAVVLSGEVGSVGNSAYGVLLDDVVVYDGRKGDMIALNLRNGANEKVEYDILVSDLNDDVKLTNLTVAAVKSLKKADKVVVKVSVDKDGDVTGIELPESVILKDAFELDDSNAKAKDGYSYKLQSSTIVFYDSNKKATTIGNADKAFKEVKADAKVYVEKGRVIAVVAETDSDSDTKNVTGLVDAVKELSSGKLEFKVFVLGETQRIITKSKTLDLGDMQDKFVDEIVTFVVGETSGEIENKTDSIKLKDSKAIEIARISGRTITAASGEVVELNAKAVIYDEDLEDINLRELNKGDVITVYFAGSSNRFVDYVLVGGEAGEVDRAELVKAVAKANAKKEADYTAASWAKLDAAKKLPETTQALVDAKVIAIEEAIAGLEFIELEEGELKGTYVPSPFSNVYEFDMPEGETIITSAKVNGTSATLYGVEGTFGRVVVTAESDVVTVVIGGTEYTIVK